MNDFQVFNSTDCEELYQFEESLEKYFGVFYAVEFGEYIKIGKSATPYKRMVQLRCVASYAEKSLGKVCVSVPHTNYSENETKIHDYFSYARKGSLELFDLTMDQFVEKLPAINIEYKDDSARIEKEVTEGAEQLISLTKGIWGLKDTQPLYEKDYKKIMGLIEDATNGVKALELKLKRYDFKALSDILEIISQTMRDMGCTSNDVDAVKSAVLAEFGYSMNDYLDFKDLYDI